MTDTRLTVDTARLRRVLAHSDQKVTERYVRRALDELAEVAALTTDGPKALPTVAHRDTKPGNGKSAGSLGGPSGTRTLDRRVKSPQCGSTIPSGCGVHGQPMGNAAEIAAQLIEAAHGESIPGALADALVAVVWGEAPEVYRLARAVGEGGPFAARRAIELAAAVLRSAAREDKERGLQGS